MSSTQASPKAIAHHPQTGKSSENDKSKVGIEGLRTLPKYIYKSLDAKSSNIRVLCLHASFDFSVVPEITIHTIELSGVEKQEYEALSYTWGSTDDPELVIVREHPSVSSKISAGRSSKRTVTLTLPVTKNLGEALRYMRFKSKDRLLWIDAICINQGDNGEKSHQVGRMADIYAQAARVIVWLGPEEFLQDSGSSGCTKPGTTLAMQKLEEMGMKITFDWALLLFSPRTVEDTSWADLDIPLPLDGKTIASISCLLQKPWFTRIWIWQEIRLANAATLMCGNTTMSWPCFQQAITLFSYKESRLMIQTAEHSDFRERLIRVFLLCSFDTKDLTMPLRLLLSQTSHCKYKDSRDRIYALLSLLCKNDQEISIIPDYSKRPEEIYQDIMLKHIHHHQSLDLMAFCELAPEESRNNGLPTWVPDFENNSTRTFGILQESLLTASAGTRPHYRYIEPDILAVKGVIVGTVHEIFSLPDQFDFDMSKTATIDLIKRYAPAADVMDTAYITGESVLDAFSKTLVLGITSEISEPPDRHGHSPLQIRKTIRDILSPPPNVLQLKDSTNESGDNLFLIIYQSLQSLRFFMTEEGHMGLASSETKAGDVIAMLLGFHSAMMLRPTERNYQVVGPCYIHGFMQGEAFLGPLSEDWYPSMYYEPEIKGYYRVFVNRRSGEITAEDPRLGPLPAGWVKVAHANEHNFKILSNLNSDEERQQDPRVTFEAIQERGVDLEEFILI